VNSPAVALVAALQATIEALESGNIEAATAGTAAMNLACEQAARAGTPFSPEQLAEARGLQERCLALATQTQAAIVAELLQSSTHRKATDAYGSGK
jgi:hypothetical protein